jgi:hypothetical protein
MSFRADQCWAPIRGREPITKDKYESAYKIAAGGAFKIYYPGKIK